MIARHRVLDYLPPTLPVTGRTDDLHMAVASRKLRFGGIARVKPA